MFRLKNFNILVVDDEKNVRDMLAAMLEKLDCTVTTAISSEQALNYAKTSPPDILLTDLNLPGMNGIELIKEFGKFAKRTVSIVLTGQGTVEMAVKAMKAGAFTFLSKPLRKSELLVTVERALEVHALKEENTNLKRALGDGYKKLMLGSSDRIQEVFDLIEAVADTDSTVLILGESGTGKELLARSVHDLSRRASHPFIAVNCSALNGDAPRNSCATCVASSSSISLACAEFQIPFTFDRNGQEIDETTALALRRRRG